MHEEKKLEFNLLTLNKNLTSGSELGIEIGSNH